MEKSSWKEIGCGKIGEEAGSSPVPAQPNRTSVKSSDNSLAHTSLSISTTPTLPVPDYVRVLLVTDMNGRKRKLYIPAALDLDRPKRPRTTFTPQQLQILEIEFKENHFITEARRGTLSRLLGLSETQIKVWFQNRRTKLRRDSESSESPVTTTVGTGTGTPFFSTPFPWTVKVSEKS